MKKCRFPLAHPLRIVSRHETRRDPDARRGTGHGGGRRRLLRPVRHPPVARAGAEPARVRGRQRHRRHLVLEPLPGRALRHREPGVLVLLLGRTAAAVALARALRLAAGHPALHRPRGRPLRPAPAHHPGHARDRHGLRRRQRPVDRHHRHRRDGAGALLRDGQRQPVAAAHPRLPGAQDVPRPRVPHGPVAARDGGLLRPARGRGGHGVVGHPGDSQGGRAGRAPDGVPAHRQLQRAGGEQADGPRSRARAQGRLRALARTGADHRLRHRGLRAAGQDRVRGPA